MIKQFLQEGFVLKSKGYYKHAIEAFYKALECDNTSSELLLEIAECYYLINKEEHALNYIEQILEKEPTHINSLKLLKKIFVDKKAWEKAEQTTKNIYYISQKEKDLVEILEILNKQKKYTEVLECDSHFDSEDIIYEKAYALLHLNRPQEAEALINEALEKNVDDKKLFLKSKILYKMDRKEEAFNIYDFSKIEETDIEQLNFAGILMQYKNNYKEAINYFLKAAKISPKPDECYYNCASTYFKMGEMQLAKKYYNLAIVISPENQNYHFALANLYYSEKHYKRALEELNYDFFEAKLLKSIILYDSGYLAIAKRELELLAKEQPENQLIIDYQNRITEELKF